MNVKFLQRAADDMRLFLASIVRDIEEKWQWRVREEAGKNLTRKVADDLAIGERTIDTCAHGAEIALPEFRTDRGSGELSIRQL